MGADTLRGRQFLLCTTMLVAALGGYGRRAYAACDPGTPPNFICSGANVTQQTIAFDNATVSTVPGFSVITTDPIGVSIQGDGALSYTDLNTSTLTANEIGLFIHSTGNVGGGNPGSVYVQTNGTLTGGRYGLFSLNDGAGALTVTTNGDVTGTTVEGIFATSYGTDLSVTTGPGTTVTGRAAGIRAFNYGTGATSVTANGDVTATNLFAIYAKNSSAGTDLSVATGADSYVYGFITGIRAMNYGTGSLEVTADGDVRGQAVTGIFAFNSGAGEDLTVTTGAGATTFGGRYGIYAKNEGTGALSVTTGGDATGIIGDGIAALNGASGTDLSVSTGGGTATTGGEFGIRALNYGTGAMSIAANGDVTGTDATGYGIYARNRGNGLDITTGFGSNVTGGDTGISAFNLGTGDMTVALNGDVTGTNDTGAELFNFNLGDNIDVTTGFGTTVSGLGLGLRASNSGSGDTTVNVNGDVASTSGGTGLYGVNFSNARDISITTAVGTNVTGSAGIFSRSFGTGDMTITANGDVTGSVSTGIEVRNYADDVTVNTGQLSTVTGGSYGILVRNEGTGALAINANGDVAGGLRYGIFARNEADGTDLRVTTGLGTEVSGGEVGIDARNFGSGDMLVTANGDVTGNLRQGIFAFNSSASTGELRVTTAVGTNVNGGTAGIGAANYGTGALTVTANGDTTGTNNVGIYARNNTNSTGDLSVTTGAGTSTSSNTYGIFTRNFADTALTITANGDVAATARDGIHAENYGTDLSIATGTGTSVTGGTFGIRAFNYGTGAMLVTTNGDVTGNNADGIRAENYGTDLTVTTGAGTATTGGSLGIRALNRGTGALAVTADGDVTGEGAVGIYARNFASGTNLSVTTGAGSAATGPTTGIRVQNDGSGATLVASNGDASGNFYGIEALNTAAATGLTVTTGAGSAVTGGVDGIRAVNEGTGALSVTADGDVTGTDDAGVYARHANGGPIDVTVGAGATAEGGASGVHISAGSQNSLTNFGTVRNLAGITGVAIVGGTGSETVDNFGLVTGDVLLGTGVNAFNNLQGGLFESGADVALGAGNTLSNSGALSPGGAGNVQTTALTGNFEQTGAGQFLVDIDGASADRVDASGSAAVNGKVRPNYTLASLGSNTQWTVLTATSPIVDNGIKATSTPVVQFDVVFPTATQMDLRLLGVDFAVSGLNRNERAIAENLTAIFNTGNFAKMDSALNAIAFLPTTRAIANALDQLSPEIYLDTEIATLFAAQSFTNSLMTCPTYAGANAFIQEGQCVWARVSGRSFDQDATFETLGINETSFQVAGGVQGALGDVWRLGFAGAIEQGNLDTSTNAQSDFDRGHAGAVLKYNPGPLLLAAAVSGGWGRYETTRPIDFPGFSSLATSDHEIGYLDGRFRAAYLFTNGTWYAKPMADFDATRIDLDDVTERARGGVGLKVRGNDQTVLSATPALELGLQFGSEGGTLFRPYVRGGATFFDDPNFVLLASFEGSPSGVGPFRIETATDDVVAVVAAGIDVIGASGASFRLYYDGRFGETVEANEGGIKATLAF